MNAATAAQKMVEKPRFGELPREGLKEIMDNAVPVKTKATKIGMRLFNGTYLLSFAQKLQNFKYDRGDFTHS